MEQNKTFFSIVIPVYDGLSHNLPICLNSIWKQPLEEYLYEVICVDDCSTDDTRTWLKEQCKLHDNLRLIENRVNIRQGGGRNKGVKAAKGKYIMFIDQDDYFHKDVFLSIYKHLQKVHLEILIVDCAYQFYGKESNILQHNFPHKEIMTGDDVIEKNGIPFAPWKFIFLRELMISKKIFFVENERIEDVDWCHLLVHHAIKVQYQPILFIHYNKNNLSTTITSFKSKETNYSTLHLGNRIDSLIENNFKSSSKKTKLYLLNIEKLYYYIGVRNYFFFYDKLSTKAYYIIDTITKHKKRNFSNIIVSFAGRFPYIFSAISNCLYPFGRISIIVYRKLKYK